MAPCSAVALVALIALAGAARADAALFDSPLKTAIDTAVQDAVKKVLAGFGAVGGEIGDAAAPALPVLGATSAFATQLAGDYAAMGKFAAQSVKSLGGQFGDHLVGLGASLGNVGDTVGAALEAYDARYCEPAVCKPPAKQKAEFTGPGFTLTLSVGNCTFSEAALLTEHRKELECLEPYVEYTKTPAKFVSKHVSAPSFTAKSCKVKKAFGEEAEKVLYVFDGTPVDVGSLTTMVMGEVKGLLGGLATGHEALKAQMQALLGGVASGVLA